MEYLPLLALAGIVLWLFWGIWEKPGKDAWLVNTLTLGNTHIR